MEDKLVLDLFGKFVNTIMSVLSPLGREVEPGVFELKKIFTFMLVGHFVMDCGVVAYGLDQWNTRDFVTMTDIYVMILMYTRSLLYLVLAFVKRDEFQELANSLVVDRKSHQNKIEHLKMSVKFCKMEIICTISLLLSLLILVSSVMMTINAFIIPNELHLPLNFYIVFLPFDEPYSFKWLLNYLYQVVSSYNGTAAYVTYFPMIMILMNHSCWKVDSTLLSVEALKKLSAEKESLTHSKDFRECMSEVIERCMKVIAWQQQIQSILQLNFLLEFAVSSVFFCLSFYTMKADIFDSFYISTQLPVILVQIFVYCWTGSKYKSRVETLSAELYNLEWDEFTPKQRRDLQLTLLMTQNVEGFNGFFKSVDLATFQKIIELSYTLLAVLRTTKTQ